MKKTLRLLAAVLAFMAVGNVSIWAQDETIDLTAQGYTNAQPVSETLGTDCKITYTNGTTTSTKYYTSGAAVRIYGGGSFTVSSDTKNIASMTLTFSATTNAPNAASVASTGTLEIGSNVQPWTATETTNSVTFTRPTGSGHWRLQKVEVFFAADDGTIARPKIEGETPFIGSTEVTITAGEGLDVYYTTDGSDPTTSSQKYAQPFTLDASATVKAIATDGTNISEIAEKSFEKVMTTHAGTAEDPFDIADALAAIEAGLTDNEYYVAGIVSQIDEVSIQYGNATYFISDDGTTGNQFEIYRGKYLNGEKFTSEGQITVGSKVVVKGKLVLYNNKTPEMAAGNQLVSIELKGNELTIDEATNNTITAGPANVTLARTFNASAWNTIVLPFDMTAEQIAATFGSDARVATYTGSTHNASGTYTLNFTSTNTLTANEPAFIYGANDEGIYEIDSVEVVSGEPEAMTDDDIAFIGSYNSTTAQAGDFFIAADNNFYRAKGGEAVKATRAVFRPSATSGAKTLVFSIDGETTAIVGISDAGAATADTDAPAYNLAGQRVGSQYRGIVIRNGRKEIVK